ncbi:MAG TPA: sulfite exporter TauE/SafE family protein [Sporolactobacillaceae bacterium]|nr:sulfite exporter TauE/SafE family protein [Sporolactobacillaceae bacterium]
MFLTWGVILITGFLAGLCNTMAGGGSLLTLPALIFAGLPASVANGTNRIALIISSGTAAANFQRKGHLNKITFVWLSIPAIIGSIIGADFAISLSDRLFNFILAAVMVVAVAFVVWKPKVQSAKDGTFVEKWTSKQRWMSVIIFFFVGLYGGFIQAGIGFVIITVLSGFLGFPLVRSNAYKNAVVGLYIFCSLLVFILHNEINWAYGILLAVGNTGGAYLGSRIAMTKGDRWIKAFLVVAVVGMAIKLILS